MVVEVERVAGNTAETIEGAGWSSLLTPDYFHDPDAQVAAAVLAANTDAATARHSDEVEMLSGEICSRLGVNGSERETILLAARLHDVGKVAVPIDVLEKPEPLSAAEWAIMKEHTIVGERILRFNPDLARAAPLVRHSHENFDGSGYPDGLRGEAIPLGSRIILCVDAFHAIRCDRPYRAGRSTAEALAEIQRHAGRQFDPQVVAALFDSVALTRVVPKRRIPRRLAILLSALVIGGGGAYAAERGWIPSPIPGIGPDRAANEETTDAGESASATTAASDDPVGADDDADSADGAGGTTDGPGGGAPSDGAGGGTGSGSGNSSAGGSSAGGGSTVGGSPGNSGNAPAQTGSAPGQSGSTPGLSGSTPGRSGSTPGNGAGPPGLNGSTPGQSGSTPAQSGSTPGQSGSTPGQSGSIPGASGTRGSSGTPPGLDVGSGNGGIGPGLGGSGGNPHN